MRTNIAMTYFFNQVNTNLQHMSQRQYEHQENRQNSRVFLIEAGLFYLNRDNNVRCIAACPRSGMNRGVVKSTFFDKITE